jgi:hypothetical protein
MSDRASWRTILSWPASCEEAFQTSHASDDPGLTFHQLAPGLSLVDVLCAAGGYAPSHLFIRLDERGSSVQAAVLAFPVLHSPDGETIERAIETEVWGQATVASDTRQLSLLTPSRQLGDCGVWTLYTVATEQPRILEAASRLPCPATPGEPADPQPWSAPPGWRRVSPDK